jgi:hypothetical protein
VFFFISWVASDNTFTIARSALNYISLSIISLAVCCSCVIHNGINEKWIQKFIIIWLIVGIIQFFFYRFFGAFIVSNMRTTVNRGVCSLASEPSFYGYMCFFFLFISHLFKSNKIIFTIILIFQILFIAQSSVSMIYVIILFGISSLGNAIRKKSIKAIILILFFIMLLPICVIVMQIYFPASRITHLINMFLISDISMTEDASIEQRTAHIKLSFMGFVENFSMPHFFHNYISNSGRIMSGYGALIYELGFVGVIYIINYYQIVKYAFNKSHSLSLLIIMFSAIQIGIPIFAFIIGYSMSLYILQDKIHCSNNQPIT